MILVRKIAIYFFVFLLFASLLGIVLSTSLGLTVSNPVRVEAWTVESNLYENLINSVVTDTQQSLSTNYFTPTKDQLVSAAEKAFPRSLYLSSINSIIIGNYVWLNGWSVAPKFDIDLSQAKLNYASELGTYASNNFAKLPICTTGTTNSASSTAKPTCRQSVITPKSVGSLVSSEIIISSNFNPYINQDTLTISNQGNSTTYYNLNSSASKNYQFMLLLPHILSAVFIISLMVIYLLTRRFRRVFNFILYSIIPVGLVSLLILLIVKYLAPNIDSVISNSTFIADYFKPSLISISHSAISRFEYILLIFTMLMLFISSIMLIMLVITKEKVKQVKIIHEKDINEKPLPEKKAKTQVSRAESTPLDTTRPMPEDLLIDDSEIIDKPIVREQKLMPTRQLTDKVPDIRQDHHARYKVRGDNNVRKNPKQPPKGLIQ